VSEVGSVQVRVHAERLKEIHVMDLEVHHFTSNALEARFWVVPKNQLTIDACARASALAERRELSDRVSGTMCVG
jgi:hypothetical protein